MAHNIPTDDDHLYIVWPFDDDPVLTEMLHAVVKFKRNLPERWPSMVKVHRYSRCTLELPDAKVTHLARNLLINALYMSAYAPRLDEHGGIRTATRFKGKRMPAGVAYRNRKVICKSETSEKR